MRIWRREDGEGAARNGGSVTRAGERPRDCGVVAACCADDFVSAAFALRRGGGEFASGRHHEIVSVILGSGTVGGRILLDGQMRRRARVAMRVGNVWAWWREVSLFGAIAPRLS